ncbi:dihydrolipoamide acetyltransferase family protein [Streptomyces sp. NPDC004629]|uniref:dihydrolipoamide acetyltransferase family protein n=1 Tax=Streptomyces sp. NPDC004629 TaxID=3364705 RepID=UPI0036C1D6A9
MSAPKAGVGDTNVREFALPDLGEGLTEAQIVRWLVAVGDSVAVDQPVAEVETAKAVVEVPTPYAGVVTRLCGAEGDTVGVGAPLVTVGDGTPPKPPARSGNVLVGYGTSPAPQRRRARVTGPQARTENAPAETPRVISPVVRRLARERGVDLSSVSGTGPHGLILRADVERASEEGVRIPLTGLRRTVADKLAHSHREIPAAACWVDVDATRLLEARRQLSDRGAGAPRIPLFAFLARICTVALRQFPELNATVDTERQDIVRFSAVHLGFAAQTDRGLVVPVIKDAHRLTLVELAAEAGRLTTAAREGRLTPDEVTGSTFTLNNYGVFGVDGATPLLNHPEAGMLGVGRIIPRVWAVEGRPEVRHVGQFSCTFDHRVCDGGAAAGFLRRVADLVEEPLTLLGHV